MSRIVRLISVLLLLSACSVRQEPLLPKERSFAAHPKNIILLIGDGMGLSQVSAFLYENGNQMALEHFPVVGFQKTISNDNLVTDSAASATAIATGKKTNNNFLSLSSDSSSLKTILEEAEERRYATGLLATSSIVHATPAAFIAHQPLRSFYEQIAADFLKTDIDLFIGGGEKYFSTRAYDRRNLVKELEAKGYMVSRQLPSLKVANKYPGIAVFTAEEQPLAHGQGRNYLKNAVTLAASFLQSKSENGFFMMAEGSQIDWACHANNSQMFFEEMEDFDAAVMAAYLFARQNGETLVIVTGDHECGGLAINAGKKFGKLDIQFTSKGHTGTMIPVFAYGPKAELFSGIYDNTAIYHKMRQAFGWEKM